MQHQVEETAPKREIRTSGYPRIDLEQAIRRARQLWDKQKRQFARIETVVGHWGYQSKSGPAASTLAALIKFGLLVTTGSGEDRKARVSKRALRILTSKEDSSEWIKSISAAARKPAIHQKIRDKWRAGLPSDEELRTYLLKQEGFSNNAAREFIPQIRKTFAFAQLEAKQPAKAPIAAALAANSAQEFNWTLPSGNHVHLRFSHSLQWVDWQKLRNLVDVLEPAKPSRKDNDKE